VNIRTLLLPALLLAPAVPAFPQSAPAKDGAREARRRAFKERQLDHFNLGVEAPIEWILETREKNGAAWDIEAIYLSGGAGLDKDPYWIGLDVPAKRLAWAKQARVTPWFTFYLLAASAPAKYQPGPAKATPVNAKVPATMKHYFTLFKTLMEICGKQASGPVLVHVEPDEWCHLLLSGGMDPTKVDVKVGSCGLEELKDLPDNLFGFAAAFKKLRDLYAPNHVLLGCNPSGWDWQGSMTGEKMGAMMKQVALDFDFACFETSDRDKGMKGQLPPYGTRIDVTGELENHLKWIADFHAASNLPVFVWQVASGNTYFATCNNTPGHYADGLAQMLLEDYPKNPTISRYAKAGCIGWVFYGGQEQSTRVYDYRKDGVTNPTPISGNLGNKSEYADDDGGYMRLRGGAYYKNPYPLSPKAGKSPAPAAKAAPTEARPSAPRVASPEVMEAWSAKLRSTVKEDLKAGRRTPFVMKSLGQTVSLLSLDDAGMVKVSGSGSEFSVQWADFNLQDRRNLAVARLRETRTVADLCLAAFYQMACGEDAAVKSLLRGVPADAAEEVLSAFKSGS